MGYDSRHLQADCQEPGYQLRNPTLANRVWATFTFFYLRLSWVRHWAADKIAERFVDDLFDGEDARGDAHRASERRRLIEGHAAGLGARLGRSVVGDCEICQRNNCTPGDSRVAPPFKRPWVKESTNATVV